MKSSEATTANASPQRLKRELGVVGATAVGLGSMVGTGVFVSIGVAAGVAGPSVILAITAAALVATCNAFSSAQLAASHPESGGTYEYGYRYLKPWLGFTAGWMFLCAKTASAATAALGFAGYMLHLLGVETGPVVWIALGATGLLTLLVLGGVRRSNWMNMAIVGVTLGALILFIALGTPTLLAGGGDNLMPFLPTLDGEGVSAFLYATALMFVAFTGYGRIATMAEEVKDPKRVIPRAITLTLLATGILYILVAVVGIAAAGAEGFAVTRDGSATPLEAAASMIGQPGLATIVAIGAVTAMLGVLLNLILGLSRIILAMGRRGDLPPLFGRLNDAGGVPAPAIMGVGIAIGGVALTGSVETTWAFSAFTVLIYYAITNLAALQLPKAELLFPRGFAIGGLAACLFLAFWVPTSIWMIGIVMIVAGLLWHRIARRLWVIA